MKTDLKTMSRAVALTAAALLAATAARAQDVSVDYDKAANFGAYKTFAVKIGTAWGNPLSEKRVTGEITSSLVEKGWKVAPEDKADVIVVLHGATETKKTLDTFYTGGYGGYRWGGMGGSSQTTVREYTVGTLVTDMFDAKSKSLIWRGTASDELSEKPDKNAKKLAKAGDKLFKDFPPGSAKK
jgi:hypothetical protein